MLERARKLDREALARAWTVPLDPKRVESKRELLIKHGLRLLHRHGVSATGLNEILQAAGMGKSQFYHYFEHKDDFVCAVLRSAMDFFLTRVATDIGELRSLDEFDAWFEPYVALGVLPDNLGCPIGSMAGESSHHSDAVAATLRECFDRWLAGLRTGLRYWQSHQPVRASFDPEATARLLASTIQGALLLGRSYRSAQYIYEAREHLRSHLQAQLDPGAARG